MPDAIVLSSSGSGQTGVVSGSTLVTQVARAVGGESETEIRQQALDSINRVRIELNQHDWRFMKRTDSPITLVDGTATYSLQSTFRKPSYAGLIDSTGARIYDLLYAEDEVMVHQNPDMSSTGMPVYYILRNDFNDGLVTLFPTPDANAAADWRLSIEYLARIGAISDSSDSIELPEEATNVLVIGGQAYILRERDRANPASAIAWQDYQRAKMLLLSNDRRVDDNQVRFRLGVRHAPPFGTMYIRV